MSRIEPSAPVPTTGTERSPRRWYVVRPGQGPATFVLLTHRDESLSAREIEAITNTVALEEIDEAGTPAPPSDTREAQRGLLDAVWNDDLAERVADQFDWTAHLPQGGRQEFVSDLRRVLADSHETGDLEPFALLVHDWRRTAEVYADPALLEALSGKLDLDFEDDDIDKHGA